MTIRVWQCHRYDHSISTTEREREEREGGLYASCTKIPDENIKKETISKPVFLNVDS